MKAGIEAHLIKEGLSEWDELGQVNLVQDGYCTNWWKPGSRPKRRPVIYSISLYSSSLLLHLCYTEFNYPRDGCGVYTCAMFSDIMVATF